MLVNAELVTEWSERGTADGFTSPCRGISLIFRNLHSTTNANVAVRRLYSTLDVALLVGRRDVPVPCQLVFISVQRSFSSGDAERECIIEKVLESGLVLPLKSIALVRIAHCGRQELT